MTTRVERLAAWAARVTGDDLPADVRELCRTQRRSVLGACAASAGAPAAGRVRAAVAAWAGDGPAPLPGSPRRVRVEDALYAASALSVALDFDDYQLFGHTGHSAVLVPLLLATETGADGDDQLVAQAVAAEVGARLGGACLLGPLNGQQWSFLHAAAGALAAGRLLGLDERGLAHALALGLWHAPRATTPGLLAPDAKLTVAADPAVAGLRAARLAAAGVTGPLDVLDHPAGFLDAFAHAPLPAMLGGLGEGWSLRTLCVKPYPGCAYVDTAVDALLSLGPPAADTVARVEVDAGILSCEMDALSREYTDRPRGPTPVTATFSLRWILATALVSGELTPAGLRPDALARPEVAALVRRVEVRHDWALTRRTAERTAPLLPLGALLENVPRRRLVRALLALRRERGVLRAGPGEAVRAARAVGPTGARRIAAAMRGRRPWDPRALAAFRMTFPARVTVRLRDGGVRRATVDVPRGGAGHARASPESVSRTKLADHGPALWGRAGTAAIADAVDRDADDLPALLGEPAAGAGER